MCAVAPKDTSSRTYAGSLSQLHFNPQARHPKRADMRHRACRTGLERAGAEPLPAAAAGSAARRSLSGSLSHRGASFTSPVNAALVAVPSRPGRGLQPPLSGTSPHGPRRRGPRAQPTGLLLPSPHEWLLPGPSPPTPPRWFRPPPSLPLPFPAGRKPARPHPRASPPADWLRRRAAASQSAAPLPPVSLGGRKQKQAGRGARGRGGGAEQRPRRGAERSGRARGPPPPPVTVPRAACEGRRRGAGGPASSRRARRGGARPGQAGCVGGGQAAGPSLRGGWRREELLPPD